MAVSLQKVSVQKMGKGLSCKQDLLEGIIHWLNPQWESAIEVGVTISLHSQLPTG